MLELYHWEPNAYFLKPLIALEEKQISFVSHWFDPTAFEQCGSQFPHSVEIALNLDHEGPVLQHKGALICGSYFMLEYIAEALPGPELYPGGPLQRYGARAWGQRLATIGADVCLLGSARYLPPRFAGSEARQVEATIARIEPLERRNAWRSILAGAYDEPALAKVRERLRFALQRIESALAASQWLGGAEYSVADIDAFALLWTLPDLAPQIVNARSTPHILLFIERMHARAAVQRALAYSRNGRPQEAFVPGAEPSRWG